ncbi:hypothetical protein [Actinoplanes utahensis]|uniref:YbaB/EbfC DNA-binding family protein n=1 Tax=Actinoplanes utahensis TaxID=1869 RepID=A0A0A6UQQ4_ACTUT|nr:hypothetical protein [Actinoplanes utahensis]KHD76714.1 hypothetical protein MB27_15625 [Actinoplanes utahensis]
MNDGTYDAGAGPLAAFERLAASMRSFPRSGRQATGSDARFPGSDTGGLATVVADETGRVVSVRVDRDRFPRRSPSALGPALFEAYQAAMTGVMTALAGAMDAADRAAAARHDEPAAVPAPPVERAGRASGFRAPGFDELRERLRALEDRQYERQYQRERRRAARPAEHTLHGPNRLVTVLVRGGDVGEITVRDGIGPADAAAVEQDVVRALRAMRERDDSAGDRETGGE